MRVSPIVDAEPPTPEQIIVHQLHEQGWTDQEIASIRFVKLDTSLPFHSWSFTYTGAQRQEASSLARALAFLNVVNAGVEISPDNLEAGFRLVNEVIAEPFTALGLRTQACQAERAAQPRGKLADGSRMNVVISQLANSPEHRDLTARELWPHFLSALEERGLDPNEPHRDVPRLTCVQYDSNSKLNKTATMTLRSFANAVSKARKPKS